MNVAYMRCSAIDQSFARQEEILKGIVIDKTFKEKASGRNRERKELDSMLQYIREGDHVYIADISRIARNTRDLLNIIEEIKSKGCKMTSVKDGLAVGNSATDELITTVLGAVYSFELAQIKERQRIGIEYRKATKGYPGKQPTPVPEFEEKYELFKKGEIKSKVALAKELGVGRTKLYKLIKKKEQQDDTGRVEE